MMQYAKDGRVFRAPLLCYREVFFISFINYSFTINGQIPIADFLGVLRRIYILRTWNVVAVDLDVRLRNAKNTKFSLFIIVLCFIANTNYQIILSPKNRVFNISIKLIIITLQQNVTDRWAFLNHAIDMHFAFNKLTNRKSRNRLNCM